MEIELNANKTLCRRIWTSFGVNMSVFSHIDPIELIKLQLCNKFLYEKAISRVQGFVERLPI